MCTRIHVSVHVGVSVARRRHQILWSVSDKQWSADYGTELWSARASALNHQAHSSVKFASNLAHKENINLMHKEGSTSKHWQWWFWDKLQ